MQEKRQRVKGNPDHSPNNAKNDQIVRSTKQDKYSFSVSKRIDPVFPHQYLKSLC